MNTEDSCKQSCSDYTKTKNYACSPDTVCSQAPAHRRHLTVCKGDIRDCVDLGDIDTHVCHSADPVRRYNFIKYSNEQVIGLKPSSDQKCELESKVSKKHHILVEGEIRHLAFWVSNSGRQKHGEDGL